MPGMCLADKMTDDIQMKNIILSLTNSLLLSDLIKCVKDEVQVNEPGVSSR